MVDPLSALSGYYLWSARCLQAEAAQAPDRRQRWQHKGAVAGAVVGDTFALAVRLLIGTKGFGSSCTRPDLRELPSQKLGVLGTVNGVTARAAVWLGRGLGGAVGVLTVSLGLLLGYSASAWVKDAAARGALLGAAFGRLLVGPAELSRSFNVLILHAFVRVLTGMGELVGGALADFYAVGGSNPEEALSC